MLLAEMVGNSIRGEFMGAYWVQSTGAAHILCALCSPVEESMVWSALSLLLQTSGKRPHVKV